MNNLPFVHLRMHSEFSVTDSIIRIDDAANTAVADNMPALAVTDKMSLFSLVKEYKTFRDKGVQPIFGVDFHYIDPNHPNKICKVLLLAKNTEGYLWLSRLLTRVYTRGYKEEAVGLRSDIFEEPHNDNIVILSGGHDSDVQHFLQAGEHDNAFKAATEWKNFCKDYYLEIQRVKGFEHLEPLLQKTLWLSDELAIPVVATHPVQFLKPTDFEAHEIRTCIANKEVYSDANRPRRYVEDQYFKSQIEMKELFKDIPQAVENSAYIAMKCNTSLTLGKNYLPQFPTPDGMTLNDFLAHLSEEGLKKRMEILYPNESDRQKEYPRYQERLAFEIKTICDMGFPGYFLIVQDFINWAKNNGCPVGPGRGSGAGSLVAFSLGITDIDPLAYALLFERFLNPERVSMPDFDIDFCQDNRNRVIDYVRHKYGVDAVSQIATFGTMAARGVVKDVGRALNLPYYYCESLSNLIPNEPGKEVTLEMAIEQDPELARRIDEEEDAKAIFDVAKKLYGLTRSIGMHAGGVLIAPGKIDDFCPMYQSAGDDSVPVSMLDKDDVEKIGLVKFDFLGLKNLTIIDMAVKFIKERHADQKDLDVGILPYTDPDAFQILKDGNTTSVFQVESDGMKKLVRQLQPDCFEDIIAVLALYRPGPLGSGMVDSFIKRKAGKENIDYYDDDLKDCLSPTYGVIVYQEQVMQISQIMGGYTLGAADMLRRAMGKKKPEEMAKHRDIFVAGALEKGKSPELATKLFDLMAMFAEYGFNKSHTAAYAAVTYQTAWLKAHYLAEFMAATMSADMTKTDDIKVVLDDAKNNGITFLAPSINESQDVFSVVNDTTIRYALGAIKGLGSEVVQEILRLRKEAPFKSLEDVCLRLPRKMANKKTILALINSGAVDCFGINRTTLSNNVEKLITWANKERENQKNNQGSLFDLFEETNDADIFEFKMFDDDLLAIVKNEYSAFGFYFNNHPFEFVRHEFRNLTPLHHVPDDRKTHVVAGWVTQLDIKNRNNGKLGYFTLENGKKSVSAAAFSDAMREHGHLLKDNMPIIVEGTLRYDAEMDKEKFIISRLWDLHSARKLFARTLNIHDVNKDVFAQLKPILNKYAEMAVDNGEELYVNIVKSEGDTTIAAFPEPIFLHPRCLEEIEEIHPNSITFEW